VKGEASSSAPRQSLDVARPLSPANPSESQGKFPCSRG
jgi:hypothetical protein